MRQKATHKYVSHGDHRSAGQSEYDFAHSTACGYVRDAVTVDDSQVTCKLCLRAMGEGERMGIARAIEGVDAFFEDEGWYRISGIVDAKKVRGQRQTDECRPVFDHCYVDQDGGGITGDDFHGMVYFHIGAWRYLAVEY